MKQLLWLYSLDESIFEEISWIEKHADFAVHSAGSVPAALQQLRDGTIDVILVTLPHRGWEPEEILTELQRASRSVPVIFYEPGGSMTAAVHLTRLGAFHYIGQPASAESIQEVLALAAPHQTPAAREEAANESWLASLVGKSRAMSEVIELIRLVGPRRSTVLITGETGTGKEVAARAIHMASTRAHLPMVTVNCAAIPENLLEAELFGHTKGAFTGAVNARTGLFEQAHRGTIFLDEIGDMPLQLQSKLLRVLQERELHRVGSSETIRVDVRVIAASNTDLSVAVAQKRFRQDLFYRLNVVPLRMPPLRDRISDIPALVDHLIRKICEQEGTSAKQASSETLAYLMNYAWPGNVRQLEHAVESAVALSGDRRILCPNDFNLPAAQPVPELGMLSGLDVPESGIDFEELISTIERTLLERALLKSGGNKARAADLLNMKRTTLISKFKALQTCA